MKNKLSDKELDILIAEHETKHANRIRISASHIDDSVPWFLGDILAYLSGRSAYETKGFSYCIVRANVEELGWFMSMSELGDLFSGNNEP